jgi:prolyl-tRNA editing enzyme YbaK/EbsC (Cys-tRNA(Pro) deacylase)
MSKSLARVTAALQAAGLVAPPLEMPDETRTAIQAAAAAGCHVDQIVKSILFQGADTAQLFLFLTSGGRTVDLTLASALAGEALTRAEIARVREVTGFAIGGVAPVGHLHPLPIWMDRALMAHRVVWSAAGTPRHIFAASPHDLLRITSATLADFTATAEIRQP